MNNLSLKQSIPLMLSLLIILSNFAYAGNCSEKKSIANQCCCCKNESPAKNCCCNNENQSDSSETKNDESCCASDQSPLSTQTVIPTVFNCSTLGTFLSAQFYDHTQNSDVYKNTLPLHLNSPPLNEYPRQMLPLRI